jgi:hypothetical protein
MRAGALVSSARAQVIFGTLLGTMTDPSGAPSPGATIRVISSSTNEDCTAIPGSSGTYSVPNLLSASRAPVCVWA